MKKSVIVILFVALSFSIVYAEDDKKVINLNELKLTQQIFLERKDKLDAQIQNLQLTFKDLKRQQDDTATSLKQITNIIKEEEEKINKDKKKLEEESKKK